MTTFTDALASIGRYDPRLPISQAQLYGFSSSLTYTVKDLLSTSAKDFYLPPFNHRRKAEDGLSPSAEKLLKMRDPDAHKADLAPKDSHLATKSEKSTFTTSSSPVVPPSRKRKAADESPVPTEKSLKIRKEGGPRANLDSKDFEIAEKPNQPKSPSAMSRVHKDAAAVSKPGKPFLTLKTSSPPHTLIPGDMTRALHDPNLPPPKKGSYRELMLRKASDMVDLPPRPVYTGKQIKEAAKRKAQGKGVRSSEFNHQVSRAPRRLPADPDASSRSPEANKKIAEAMKRAALKRANRKFPRRAYKGTVAPQAQASSEGTTGPVETTAPHVRRGSAVSVTSSGTSANEMEAGYLDVEEEESRAALAAKKEDEEEARLEAELKKMKQRRKVRLAQDTPGKR